MFLSIGMLKQKYFLADIFILSAEKQPIKLSWRKIEWLLLSELCTKYTSPLQIVHLNIPLYTYDTNAVSLTKPTKLTQKQINEYCKYITIISKILSTHPQLEQFTLPNKIDVKLGLLQINCSYKVYKQTYPETYMLIQKHNAIACRFTSPKKQKLLKMAQEKPYFYIVKLILKILPLKNTLKKLYPNK